MDAEINYFVCTLGQAAELNTQNPHHFKSVNALIDAQARNIPDHPAVGFHVPHASESEGTGSAPTNAGQSSFTHYSFADLRDGSCSLARRFLDEDGPLSPKKQQTIALLAQSTPLFLLAWLGLMRAGASVLLIAPQCQPAAIVHLCRSCEVSTLLHDPKYADLAQQACNDGSLRKVEIQDSWIAEKGYLRVLDDETTRWPEVNESDVAYLHHTSGTSSGLPKPIPQTHRAAVGVLPSLNGSSAATFTTTPLYHGGIADCFRSWTSGALIWLFLGSIPITSKTVLASLASADKAVKQSGFPAVKYFSSVPYVLQLLAADAEGLLQLQSMEIVGVGGAALPEEAGNELVNKGVNLISRFGSAECGFLLSSYRDFDKDTAWQYLRPGIGSCRLRFEARDNGLAELVVLDNWPHLAKRNREDGSYATSDLLAPHSSIFDAWKYHSRADSQLTLITGKKFDPAPVEDSIAVSKLVTDVLIFGDGKQYPGALLWRSQETKDMPARDVVEAVWPHVNKLNEETQNHARVSKSMLIVLPLDMERPARSSKGTLLRKSVEQKFHETIEAAYARSSEAEDLAILNGRAIADSEVSAFLQNIIRKVTGRDKDLPNDADLFSQGVDSVACMQIQSVLQKSFGGADAEALPLNVIYDCGTIDKLAKYLISYKKGECVGEEDEHELMQRLVKKYGSFHTSTSKAKVVLQDIESGAGLVYLLTGATGALGAHILDQLIRRADVTKIVCLVRGADEHASFQRVANSLQYRRCTATAEFNDKVTCLAAKLGESHIGLNEALYASLAKEVDVIIHAAWAVNFNTRLRSFEHDHIGGIHNLINFSLAATDQAPPHFIFCSSTASVIASKSRQSGILEATSIDPSDASTLGYSRSKWVAEAICAKADAQTRLRGRVSIARVGQLCGDTRHGIWNMSEAWPLMLDASRRLGAIPDLGPEPLAWLPVDVAADALLRIADLRLPTQDEIATRVFHVLRQNNTRTWNDVIQWTKSEMGPEPLWVVSLPDWLDKLQELKEDHAAKKLMGLWRSRAEADGTVSGRYDTERDAVCFDQHRSLSIFPELHSEGVMDRETFGRLWSWIIQAHEA